MMCNMFGSAMYRDLEIKAIRCFNFRPAAGRWRRDTKTGPFPSSARGKALHGLILTDCISIAALRRSEVPSGQAQASNGVFLDTENGIGGLKFAV